jgi:hypothetical protein
LPDATALLGLIGDPIELVPTTSGDAIFASFVPHASGPNRTQFPRRILYVGIIARC